ncbi:Ubl_CysO_like domain containing protein [Burkholderiaceae bacterium]
MEIDTQAVAPQTVRVMLTGGFSRRYTDGVREFEITARTVRGVISAMDRLYPGLGEHLEEETSLAVNGVIHEVVYTQIIPADAEVFFIPRIEGG